MQLIGRRISRLITILICAVDGSSLKASLRSAVSSGSVLDLVDGSSKSSSQLVTLAWVGGLHSGFVWQTFM